MALCGQLDSHKGYWDELRWNLRDAADFVRCSSSTCLTLASILFSKCIEWNETNWHFRQTTKISSSQQDERKAAEAQWCMGSWDHRRMAWEKYRECGSSNHLGVWLERVKYFALWTKHETQDFSWHSRSHWTVAIMVRQNLKLFMLSSAGSQGRNINNLMFVSVASQPGIHLLSQFFSLDSLHTQRVLQQQVGDLELMYIHSIYTKLHWIVFFDSRFFLFTFIL